MCCQLAAGTPASMNIAFDRIQLAYAGGRSVPGHRQHEIQNKSKWHYLASVCSAADLGTRDLGAAVERCIQQHTVALGNYASKYYYFYCHTL
jgi:hypothetical protein